MQEKEKAFRGFDANTLKIIAVITMIIDHVGAAFVWQIVANAGESYETWYLIYRCMRWIGRLAFPIYCFFIVEGLEHTRNVKKYIIRLFLFAVISEIPFDYAFFGKNTWEYQNVFFTLTIGLICIWGLKKIEEKTKVGMGQMALKIIVIFLSVYGAYLLKTDYDDFGVLVIAVLYLFRKNRLSQCIAGAIGFCWEVTASFAFIPLYFYNGQKGKQMNRYIFYGIYPLHLALLSILRYLCF